MKKQYLLTAITALLLFLGAFAFNAYAASGIAAYYVGPGELYREAFLDGRKRDIKNNTAYTIFIPARTLAEQQSFLNNLPTGVTAYDYLTWPGLIHNVNDCQTIGGTIFDTGNGTICRYPNGEIPEGWTQANDWQRYSGGWGGDACGRHKSTGPTTWSDAPPIEYAAGSYVLHTPNLDCTSLNSYYWYDFDASVQMMKASKVRSYAMDANPSSSRVEVGIY